MTAFKADLRLLKATYREWIGLAVIALPCIVYAMGLTILIVRSGYEARRWRSTLCHRRFWIYACFGSNADISGGSAYGHKQTFLA